MAYPDYISFYRDLQLVISTIIKPGRVAGMNINKYYTTGCKHEATNSQTYVTEQATLTRKIAELDVKIPGAPAAERLNLIQLRAIYNDNRIIVRRDLAEIARINAGPEWEGSAPNVASGRWPRGIYVKQYRIDGTCHFFSSRGNELANGYPSNDGKRSSIGLNFQAEGSHGLCQMYALMYYLNDTGNLRTASNAYQQFALGAGLSMIRKQQAYNTACSISYEHDAIIRFYNTYVALNWANAKFVSREFIDDVNLLHAKIQRILISDVDYWTSWFFENEEPIPKAGLKTKTWAEILVMRNRAVDAITDVPAPPLRNPHIHNVLYTPIVSGKSYTPMIAGVPIGPPVPYSAHTVESLRRFITTDAILNDSKRNALCPAGAGPKIPFAHQELISKLFTSDYPYPGILLWHGLGSGKTLTSLGLSKTHATSNTLFISPAGLLGNFRTELTDMLTCVAPHGNVTRACPLALHAATTPAQQGEMERLIGESIVRVGEIRENDRDADAIRIARYEKALASQAQVNNLDVLLGGRRTRKFKSKSKKTRKYVGGTIPIDASTLVELCNMRDDTDQIKWPIGKSVDVHYIFLSSNGDLMDTNKQTRINIVALHGNVLVIIDEMHLVVSLMYNGLIHREPDTKVYTDMYTILMTLPNSAKLVGLSGTPISGNVNELAVLFNLLLRMDTFSYETFSIDYPIHEGFVDFHYQAIAATNALTAGAYNRQRTDYLRDLNTKTIRNEVAIRDIISPVISFFDNIKHLMPQATLAPGLLLQGYNNDGTFLYGIDLLNVNPIQQANIDALTGNSFLTRMKSISSAYTMSLMPATDAQKRAIYTIYQRRKNLAIFGYKASHIPLLQKAIDTAIRFPAHGAANMAIETELEKIRFFTYHIALYNLIISSAPIYASIADQKVILRHLKITNIKFFKVIMNILRNPDKRHLVYIEHQRAILPFLKYMQLFCYTEYTGAVNPNVPVASPAQTPDLEFPMQFLQQQPVADAEIDPVVHAYNAHIGGGGKKIAFVTGEGHGEKDIFKSYLMYRGNEGKRVMDRETLLREYKNQGIDVPSRQNDLNVVVLNSAGTEGTNFPKTDYIHILELYGNCSRLYQTIARIVRTCAHNAMPKPPGAPVAPGVPIAPCADGNAGNDHCGVVYPILYLINTDDEKRKYGNMLIEQDKFIPYLNMIKRCSIECSANPAGNCLIKALPYT